MVDAHTNFAYSTVATAPSPATSGTSLVVGSGDGALFPAVPFNATIWPVGSQPTSANAEIVRVTNRSTDTLTITRTQESTSARTVIVGDQIAATVTAKTLTDIETAGTVKLFDSTLGSDTASIDTGATIPGGYSALEVLIIAKTSAGSIVNVSTTFNNDTAANYDRHYIEGIGSSSTLVTGVDNAQTSLQLGTAIPSGSTYPGITILTIPSYDSTNFWKIVWANMASLATTSTSFLDVRSGGWRSTAAITRIKITPSDGSNFKTGTRMVIYGRP